MHRSFSYSDFPMGDTRVPLTRIELSAWPNLVGANFKIQTIVRDSVITHTEKLLLVRNLAKKGIENVLGIISKVNIKNIHT